MYTPVNLSFTIQKWGLRASKLYRHVFVMECQSLFTGKNKKKIFQICIEIFNQHAWCYDSLSYDAKVMNLMGSESRYLLQNFESLRKHTYSNILKILPPKK